MGGVLCQARHVSVVLSRRTGVRLEDGTTYEVGLRDVVDIRRAQEAWVIGDEPAVMIEWACTSANRPDDPSLASR